MREVQKATTTPLAYTRLPWAQRLEEGRYRVEEDVLPEVRKFFLSQGRSVQVLLKDSCRPRARIYRMSSAKDDKTGTVHIHCMPQRLEETQAWCERLGLEYRGEGLAGMAQRVPKTLLRRNGDRVYLTGEQKAELLEAHGHRCAACGATSSLLAWERMVRHNKSFGEPEFRPFCSAYLKEQTAAESRSLGTDILASSFDPRTWAQYVLSPRPPPLVHRMRALPESLNGCEITDVRCCRTRELELCAHPLPMFCALDQIVERTKPVLGDLCFVTSRYKNFVLQLVYTGPGWMHPVQAEFLLHNGIISWSDISHVLTATAHYPVDVLATPAARDGGRLGWEHAGQAGREQPHRLSIGETKSCKLRSSRHDSDAPAGNIKQVFHYGEAGERI
jgi:hypothetical protein